MSSKSELIFRLQETERIIQWAINLVPDGRATEPPPHGKHPQSDKGFKTYFGDWPALRQLFHLVYYEEKYAIPAMKFYSGGPRPTNDLIFPQAEVEEKAWLEALSDGIRVSRLLDKFHELRKIQLNLISEIPDKLWSVENLSSGLGAISAEFILSKTIQHSLEHASDIMKNALYWERALEWLDSQAID